MNHIVFLDIETKPDPKLVDLYMENIEPDSRLKDPEKIKESLDKKRAEAVKEMSIDEDFSDVFCVGIKEYGKPPKTLTLQQFSNWLGLTRDVELVPGTSSRLKNFELTMVTFNGKEFDIPILIKNSIKHKVPLPIKSFLSGLDKFKGTKHIDLMQKLNFRWGKQKSLDKYLQIYLGIKKKEIDFATCTDEELKAHCEEDLVNTEKLFDLFKDVLV